MTNPNDTAYPANTMTQKLKRYDLSVYEVPFDGCKGTMAPSLDGNYVTYEDYQKIQEQLEMSELALELVREIAKIDGYQNWYINEARRILEVKVSGQ